MKINLSVSSGNLISSNIVSTLTFAFVFRPRNVSYPLLCVTRTNRFVFVFVDAAWRRSAPTPTTRCDGYRTATHSAPTSPRWYLKRCRGDPTGSLRYVPRFGPNFANVSSIKLFLNWREFGLRFLIEMGMQFSYRISGSPYGATPAVLTRWFLVVVDAAREEPAVHHERRVFLRIQRVRGSADDTGGYSGLVLRGGDTRAL